MKKNKLKVLLIAVTGLVGASLLQGCVVRPMVVARNRPCYHCHWHRHHYRPGNCWVNRRGVMHCRG
jgi:hypothetical protein